MTVEERLRANAELVIKTMREMEGVQLQYDEPSVAWLANYIERNRHLDAQTIGKLINVLGSFLGECLCRQFRGKWEQSRGDWGVTLPLPRGLMTAYPFNKVEKQFNNGIESGDSVLGFFQSAGAMVKHGI